MACISSPNQNITVRLGWYDFCSCCGAELDGNRIHICPRYNKLPSPVVGRIFRIFEE